MSIQEREKEKIPVHVQKPNKYDLLLGLECYIKK